MDPNLFHIDFAIVSEVIISIMLLALMLERALAVIFENRWFMQHFVYRITRARDLPDFDPASGMDPDKLIEVQPRFGALKELITVTVCLSVCIYWKFDAFSILMPVAQEKVTFFGEFLTAMIIAGGSKGAIKLFSDWLQIKSSAQTEIDVFRNRQRSKGKRAKA